MPHDSADQICKFTADKGVKFRVCVSSLELYVTHASTRSDARHTMLQTGWRRLT